MAYAALFFGAFNKKVTVSFIQIYQMDIKESFSIMPFSKWRAIFSNTELDELKF